MRQKIADTAVDRNATHTMTGTETKTKQEEIREGIVKNLNEFRQELQKPGALINVDTLVMLQGAFADKIMADESKQGAVLKVERELPTPEGIASSHYEPYTSDWARREVSEKTQQTMLKAGYCAVEPLVEEKEDDSL